MKSAMHGVRSSESPSSRRMRMAAVVLVAGWLASSCAASVADSPPVRTSRDIRATVTSDVGKYLSGTGSFAFGAVAASGADGRISGDAAAQLAKQYLSVFGKYLQNPFDPLRGEHIDLNRLIPSRSIVLAESPVEGNPADGGGPLRKAIGDYFLVDFFAPESADRVLSVAVSAYASDIHFTADGIEADGAYGNEFRVWVAPKGTHGEPRLSAEEAVASAFASIGHRVSALPQFVRAHPQIAPQIGRWRLTMESPAALVVEASGKVVTTSVVYVNADGRLQVPSQQAAAVPLPYVSLADRTQRLASLTLRPGHAIAFESVRPR